MKITTAETQDEQEQVFRLRYSICIEEMGKPMPGADHKQRMLRDALDERATHLCARRNGELIATLRIFWGRNGIPDSYKSWYALHEFDSSFPTAVSFTGRLMVAGVWRGSTVALALASEAYRLGRLNGIIHDFIHTTPPLVPFFERLGHRCYCSDFIDPDLGPRIPMVLALNDLGHLAAQKSPFLPIALQRSRANRRTETRSPEPDAAAA